jgi:hypothetical protein
MRSPIADNARVDTRRLQLLLALSQMGSMHSELRTRPPSRSSRVVAVVSTPLAALNRSTASRAGMKSSSPYCCSRARPARPTRAGPLRWSSPQWLCALGVGRYASGAVWVKCAGRAVISASSHAASSVTQAERVCLPLQPDRVVVFEPWRAVFTNQHQRVCADGLKSVGRIPVVGTLSTDRLVQPCRDTCASAHPQQ